LFKTIFPTPKKAKIKILRIKQKEINELSAKAPFLSGVQNFEPLIKFIRHTQE
jgi:hypothetical protein